MKNERNTNWIDSTPYGKETIQGEADRALEIPISILKQYREIADSFGISIQFILEKWSDILSRSSIANIFWNKLGPIQKRLFYKSSKSILSGTPYTIRFDSTVGEDRDVAIFEPEIQNCGDGPLFQKINEYGRDKKIDSRGLLFNLTEYLKDKGPVAVTRSKDNMTFYKPSLRTVALALKTSGIESIPIELESLEISKKGVFWTPGQTDNIPQDLLTSPSWYQIMDKKNKINMIYNQLGTKAIFYPNSQEELLFDVYCKELVDIFPTPNPLIASKIILAFLWDDQITKMLCDYSRSAEKATDTLRRFIPQSYLGSNNCPKACDILPAVIKPVFGAKQQGIKIIGLPYELERYKNNTDYVVQQYISPYQWNVKTRNGYGRFNTRLEAFCWFEKDNSEVLDFLATGSKSDIVGGNREGPMTTVFFK